MQSEAPMNAACRDTVRAAVSNGSKLLAGVDGRTATARRFRDLVAELTMEAGGNIRPLSAPSRVAIKQAAAILLRAERIQGQIVKNDLVEDDALIRLTGELRRLLGAVRRWGAAVPRSPTLADHLAKRAGERDGERTEAVP